MQNQWVLWSFINYKKSYKLIQSNLDIYIQETYIYVEHLRGCM